MEIVGNSISEVWEKSILSILEHYKETKETVITERDTTSIEIENMIMVVENPFEECRTSSKHPNIEYLNEYVNSGLDFKYQKHIYSRLTSTEYNKTHFNQLEDIKGKILNAWYTTRAVVTIWDPYVDMDSSHPPCTCLLQFYVRNQKLNLTSYFRSNDAWLCAHGDMIALTNLQKSIADDLKLEIGKYTHVACCYHIYEYDIQAAILKFCEGGIL